jgi:hypothetical protein
MAARHVGESLAAGTNEVGGEVVGRNWKRADYPPSGIIVTNAVARSTPWRDSQS